MVFSPTTMGSFDCERVWHNATVFSDSSICSNGWESMKRRSSSWSTTHKTIFKRYIFAKLHRTISFFLSTNGERVNRCFVSGYNGLDFRDFISHLFGIKRPVVLVGMDVLNSKSSVASLYVMRVLCSWVLGIYISWAFLWGGVYSERIYKAHTSSNHISG